MNCDNSAWEFFSLKGRHDDKNKKQIRIGKYLEFFIFSPLEQQGIYYCDHGYRRIFVGVL
jgi:hypothetical protein